jgi:hypothetical protein
MDAWLWARKTDDVCPAGQVKKTKARLILAAPTHLALLSRFLSGESWLLAVTLDNSITPTLVLHNTSMVVSNLYCVWVITSGYIKVKT